MTGFAMISANTNVNALYAQQALAQSASKIARLNQTINETADAETAVAITPSFLTAAIKGTKIAQANQQKNELLVQTADTSIRDMIATLKLMTTPGLSFQDLPAKQSVVATQYAAAQYHAMALLDGTGNFKFQVGPNANDQFAASLPNLSSIANQDFSNPDAVQASLNLATSAEAATSGLTTDLQLIDAGLQNSSNQLTASRDATVLAANTQAKQDLTRQNLVQQAAQSMLEQANASAQMVLDLIKSTQISTTYSF